MTEALFGPVLALALLSAGAPPEPDAQEFRVGDKHESIVPITQHDGLSEGGKIEVEPEGETLTVTMTGAAAAHCWVGAHSIGGQRFCLTQEFEIASKATGATAAEVTLESTLTGIVRGRHKGSGGMRLASAAVYAAGGAMTPLSLSYPAACAPGGCAFKYERKIAVPPATLPFGKYVLVASFLIQAEAEGFVDGHGLADFSSDEVPAAWQQEHDPFKDLDRKDFGFVIELTAEPAEPADPTARDTTTRKVKGQKSKVKPKRERG